MVPYLNIVAPQYQIPQVYHKLICGRWVSGDFWFWLSGAGVSEQGLEPARKKPSFSDELQDAVSLGLIFCQKSWRKSVEDLRLQVSCATGSALKCRRNQQKFFSGATEPSS